MAATSATLSVYNACNKERLSVLLAGLRTIGRSGRCWNLTLGAHIATVLDVN